MVKANSSVSSLQQVRLSYVERMWPGKIRQKLLEENYYFKCQCSRCVNPEKDAEMFGLRCSNSACDAIIPCDNRCESPCAKCNAAPRVKARKRFEELVETIRVHLEGTAEERKEALPFTDEDINDRIKSLLHPFNPLRALVGQRLLARGSGEGCSFEDALVNFPLNDADLFSLMVCVSKCLPRADPVRSCISLAVAVLSIQKLLEMPGDSPQRQKFLPERRRWLEEAKTCLSLTFGEDHPLFTQAQMALTLFPRQ